MGRRQLPAVPVMSPRSPWTADMSDIWIAVDVGGTFLDIAAVNRASGEMKIAKLPSGTALEPDRLAHTLRGLAEELGGEVPVDTLILGTTVVTNALLEGALARSALVTTAGFRDVLAIGRMDSASSFRLEARRPVPLVPPELTFEVDERIDVNGRVLRVLDDESVEVVAEQLKAAEVEAIAVCLLCSFANPSHEKRVADMLEKRLGVPVSASADVLPVFREHERASTTVVNVATIPVIAGFFDGVGRFASETAHDVYVMASDGGCLTTAEARRRPAKTLLSGPVGGVTGAAGIARHHGYQSVLTLDIGGTSTDVAMIRNGLPAYTDERTVGGHPVSLPSVEVHTIGAGGGSIATIDAMGLLRVGPESAGADPGPICYGRGGDQVTVTDCYLALGHLGATTMLGGKFVIDREAAIAGINHQLASRLDTDWVCAARGVLSILTNNVVGALRKISVERGYDPRTAVLVAFGGAGPLQALDVARRLQIRHVLIPAVPGVFSAYGMLSCPVRYAGYRTAFSPWDVARRNLDAAFVGLRSEMTARAQADGLSLDDARIECAVDLRYRGQSYTLTIEAGQEGEVAPDEIEVRFHREHERLYGYADTETPLEMVNLRLALVLPQPVESGDGIGRVSGRKGVLRPTGERQLWLASGEAAKVPVYSRAYLCVGSKVDGPAIVEQYDATTVLLPGDRLVLMEHADALVEVAPAADCDWSRPAAPFSVRRKEG